MYPTDEALSEADVKVKLSKTFSKILHQQESVDSVTATEIVKQETV